MRIKLQLSVILILSLVSFNIFPQEYIVKFQNEGYKETGSWLSGAGIGYENTPPRWSNTELSTVTWTPKLRKSGLYEISVWIPSHPSNDKQTLFLIGHEGTIDRKSVNMSAPTGWVTLGEYSFNADGTEFVKTLVNGSLVRVNTVKFTLVKETKANSLQPMDAFLFPEPKNTDLKEITPVDGFEITGSWMMSALKGPLKKEPFTIVSRKVGSTALWNPKLYAQAEIEVYVYQVYSPFGNDDPEAFYEIVHHGKRDSVKLDFTKKNMGWVYLGKYDFAGEGKEYVKLIKRTPNVSTRAGAVRFDILNSKENATIRVWESIYVNANDVKPVMKIINAYNFKDLENHPQREAFGIMVKRNIVKSNSSDNFGVSNKVTKREFLDYLNKLISIPYPKQINLESLTDINFIISLLANALKSSPKNLEWLDKTFKYSKNITQQQAIDALNKTIFVDELQTYKSKNLTKLEVTLILKKFAEHFIWTGPPVNQQWSLTFQDEFDGNQLNWDVWDSQNGPSHHILSSRWKENVSVTDGLLKLVTKREQRGGQEWTSAHVGVKKDVFKQAYGYWEARYKYAEASGLNQAFWMNGFYDGNKGQRAFEIDINEGHYPEFINATLHTGKNNQGVQESIGKKYATGLDLSKDFHVYALEWTPEELIFYFDGVEIDRKPVCNAHLPVWPFFSTAVINWAGPLKDSMSGKSMDVDWVRIYQKK
ncbi:family 16 glycosylhydrolase [Pedobacter glucosidilyticus]|uniref:golvesin C-terminal-like domain-containing protein n=1 Tax=Pedobacter glucosidilyticus TaxID=1122941 RepID=UPI00041FC1F5|nr:family 16 glycosylhydrolase [Pedobacter glucosidilyticus]